MTSSVRSCFKIRYSYFPKRCFDICFSLCFIFFSLPLVLLLCLIIKCTSKGSIFFSHTRIGLHGQPFKCYKFRTMVENGDKKLQQILDSNAELKKEWLANYKLKKDPRITKIGQFLRKTSLDEIPQFYNVLRGDMSIVGPRPMVKDEIERHIGSKAATILSIRPGITGLWQVRGRNHIDYPQRIALDEEYIRSHNLLLDTKIILLTALKMLTKDGAY